MKRRAAVLWWQVREGVVVAWLPAADRWVVRADLPAALGALSKAVAADPLPGVPPPLRLSSRSVSVRALLADGPAAEVTTLWLDAAVHGSDGRVRAMIPALFDLGAGRAEASTEDRVWETVGAKVQAAVALVGTDELVAAQRVPPAQVADLLVAVGTAAGDRAAEDVPEALTSRADREPPAGGTRTDPEAWAFADAVDRVAAWVSIRRNPLVIAEPGQGGEAVLRAAARQFETSVWRTSPGRVETGARFLGEREDALDEVLSAVDRLQGVLWMDDLPGYFLRPDAEGSMAALVAGWRRGGAPPVIGVLSPRDWARVQLAAPRVADRFDPVPLPPVTADATAALLDRLADHLRASARVKVTPEARRLALHLLERFVRHEALPGKALRLVLDLAAVAGREGRASVTEADVVTGFAQRTGLPPALIDDRAPLGRSDLSTRLGARLVGQPEAIAAMARVVVAWKAGVNDPNRPVATLLFAGPTGVGKTAAAKALADLLSSGGEAPRPLVRLDMSELGHPGSVARILGTATEPSSFLRQLRERPFGVVLFDEIEKAHPIVFDLLLGVLDEGRLEDPAGGRVDVRGMVLILTTNVGTRATGSLGFGGVDPGFDRAALRATFRPEFLDRLDEVVAFRPLDPDAVRAIARQELATLGARPGLASRELAVDCAESVVDLVVAAGFDARFGARPLQRAVESRVVAAISRFLVDRPGLELGTLRVDARDGEVTVAMEPA